jgi:hypothetical protein
MSNKNIWIEIPSGKQLEPVEFKVAYFKHLALYDVSYDKGEVKLGLQCDAGHLQDVFERLLEEIKVKETA